jgi:hypothetical protein
MVALNKKGKLNFFGMYPAPLMKTGIAYIKEVNRYFILFPNTWWNF